MSIKHVPKIGGSVPRIDAWDKATGRQVYPTDFFINGMLSIRVFRSPHPHARIDYLNTNRAKSVPGVVCVLTASDIPGDKKTGLLIPDMPVLCDEIVRRQGDPIAIVAAETDEIARDACNLIEVEYSLLPVVSDPRKALNPDSPLVHPNGNIVSEIHLGQGDVKKVFSKAELIFENEYFTGRQEHAHIETEGGAAYYDETRRLTVRFGGQHPHRDQEIISKILGINPDAVRVISPMVGGSFGGKDDIDVQCYLALVTYLTNRPSRIMLDRRESIIAGTKRHPFIASYKTACTAEGEITAAEVTLIADTGAYAGWGEAVINVAVETCLGPYKIPNTKVDAYCVYTNNSNASAFRGFGGLQGTFGLELQMDRMARACEMDPVDFRAKNTVGLGEKAALGFINKEELGFKQTLTEAKRGPIYSQREKLKELPIHQQRWKKRGVGIAAAWIGVGFGIGIPDSAEVHIRLKKDGTYQFMLGGTDMGQGNASALMQMAAVELNCPLENFELILGDSLGPDAGSCDASRQMAIVGTAAVYAAVDLRQKIIDEAAKEMNLLPATLELEGNTILVVETGQTRLLAGLGELVGKGLYRTPEGESLIPGIPGFLHTSGTQVALVEVDLLTGKVDVLKLHSVIDAGRVINQQGVEGQSEGGVAQGIGYALLEDTIVADGKFLNPEFSTYIIPTIADVPYDIVTTCLEKPGTVGPYGAKGIGEIVLLPTAPAILNAVYDAIGERFTKIPLSAEDILMRLHYEN